MKFAVILGTRPEALKNYSIVRAMRDYSVPFEVIHTGQHCDPLMHDQVFGQLGYEPTLQKPSPYSFGSAVDWVSRRLVDHNIDVVILNGDTAASLVGATAAMYTDRLVAHVEAGLRSFDARMLEERNRIMVDAVSHYLFTYTVREAEYLAENPELRGKIINAGNTTVDLIEDLEDCLNTTTDEEYAVFTIHRRELLRNRRSLVGVLNGVQQCADLFDVIYFPVHPHTRKVFESSGIRPDEYPGIEFIDVLLPIDALTLIRNAQVVITDSGVIQEEAYLFEVPCVTVRQNTERQQTVENGANILAGIAAKSVASAVRLSRGKKLASLPKIYGEYGAGRRIISSLVVDMQAGQSKINWRIA